ncbi:hypothetical protein [Kiloniella sp. b19]|uniref:hypothetical protein n=1 Tax=Kiloniella sp. GXU_MW_B19 TaxID=3141326 RepID=UPI0031D8C23B
MKKIIIIVLIVLLLAAAGAAAWFFLLKEDPPPEEVVEEVVEEPPLPSVTVEYQPIIINLIQENVVTNRVSIVVTMEVAEGEDHINLQRQGKRLRDRFMSELHALYSYRLYTMEGYGGDVIRKRLRHVADEIMGPELLRSLTIEVKDIVKPKRI